MNTKPFMFILALLLILPLISASFITLETTTLTNNTSTLIKVVNRGDEPAYNMQLSLVTPFSTLKSAVNPRLEVNEASSIFFPIQFNNLVPGTYPLITIIDYTDANSYPFSAITTSIVSFKELTSSNIVLSLPGIKLSGSDKLKLSIKNLGNEEKSIKARIIVPKELTIENEISLILPARQSKTITFKIEDFSARQDSNYAVFAIAEYEENNRHYTSITSASVKIVKNLGIPTNILIISLAILVLVFIAYKIKRRNESKHSNPDIK